MSACMSRAIDERRVRRERRPNAEVALLTPTQERDLAARIAAGREAAETIRQSGSTPQLEALVADADDARDHFIRANVRLVVSIASRMTRPPSVSLEDLVQDGYTGLATAVDRFDAARGFRFSTYATWWIRQAIQRGLEHTASTIRIPAHRQSELKSHLHLHDGDINKLDPKLAAVAGLRTIDSLDRAMPDGELTLGTRLPADEIDLADLVADRDIHERIRALVSTLPERTAQAIIARFGLEDGEEQTFGAIGEQLGITAEAARRRVQRGLEELRRQAEDTAVQAA